LITHPSAISGHVSMPRYNENATNAPTVIVPWTTSRPPKATTATMPKPAKMPKPGCMIA